MLKIKLTLDALQIESFSTRPVKGARGTVRGEQGGAGGDGWMQTDDTFNGPTCDRTCPGFVTFGGLYPDCVAC